MTFKKITIEINNTGNAAFVESAPEEVARLLHNIAFKADDNALQSKTIYDINGNPCGFINVE